MVESGEFTQHLLTVGDAARLLSAHENTVRRWSDKGIVRAITVGSKRHRRFRRQEIENHRLGILAHGGRLPRKYPFSPEAEGWLIELWIIALTGLKNVT